MHSSTLGAKGSGPTVFHSNASYLLTYIHPKERKLSVRLALTTMHKSSKSSKDQDCGRLEMTACFNTFLGSVHLARKVEFTEDIMWQFLFIANFFINSWNLLNFVML